MTLDELYESLKDARNGEYRMNIEDGDYSIRRIIPLTERMEKPRKFTEWDWEKGEYKEK